MISAATNFSLSFFYAPRIIRSWQEALRKNNKIKENIPHMLKLRILQLKGVNSSSIASFLKALCLAKVSTMFSLINPFVCLALSGIYWTKLANEPLAVEISQDIRYLLIRLRSANARRTEGSFFRLSQDESVKFETNLCSQCSEMCCCWTQRDQWARKCNIVGNLVNTKSSLPRNLFHRHEKQIKQKTSERKERFIRLWTTRQLKVIFTFRTPLMSELQNVVQLNSVNGLLNFQSKTFSGFSHKHFNEATAIIRSRNFNCWWMQMKPIHHDCGSLSTYFMRHNYFLNNCRFQFINFHYHNEKHKLQLMRAFSADPQPSSAF